MFPNTSSGEALGYPYQAGHGPMYWESPDHPR